VSRTQNSKDQDATASTRHDDADMNSTMQILKRKDAKARMFLGKDLILIFLALSWILHMKMQSRIRKQ
jgi:hypothetical protein